MYKRVNLKKHLENLEIKYKILDFLKKSKSAWNMKNHALPVKRQKVWRASVG
jgi:hypothetical protein